MLMRKTSRELSIFRLLVHKFRSSSEGKIVDQIQRAMILPTARLFSLFQQRTRMTLFRFVSLSLSSMF